MSVTFTVSDVAPAADALPTVSAPEALRALVATDAEACSDAGPLVAGVEHHAFVMAAHLAFDRHLPLVLSPDAVWLCIAQGFAMHVDVNAAALRPRLVAHDGVLTLQVIRDDFVKGSPNNPWPEVFGAFSAQLRAHLGKTVDLVVCDFSTSGPVERAASEIVLLDAVKHYFRLELHTRCGIPSITMEGTADDWRSVRTRARALGEFGCAAWIDPLVPVLDQLVDAADGRADAGFFRSFYKRDGGSGGPYVTGWINTLFPYLRTQDETRPNPIVRTWAEKMGKPFGGTSLDDLPSGLARAPLSWVFHDRIEFPMALLGGFVGVAQDAVTHAVRPAIGWAVIAAGEPIAYEVGGSRD